MPVNKDVWEVFLRFYQFRDWRTVMAEDDGGHYCECLLLPMKANGIMLTDNGNLPYMRFIAPRLQETYNDGFFRGLIPTITKDNHEYLVQNGYLEPDEKPYHCNVGGISTSNWRRDIKDRYAKQKKLKAEKE